MTNNHAREVIFSAFRSLQAQEHFEIYAWCAIHDEPWVARCKKGPDGLYHLVEKLQAKRMKDDAGAESGPAATAIPLEEFADLVFGCAWCGNRILNRCSCGWVCGGRERDGLFICRDSCGRQWHGVPAAALEGSNRNPQRVPMMAPPRYDARTRADVAARRPPVARPRPLLPPRDLLRLGDGSKK
jgi:hypothetical protein